MRVANAAAFELVPIVRSGRRGRASGWIGGISGVGTLVILSLLGAVVDVYGEISYA
jgi:nitrate/nitrite transporter NarK